MKLKLESEDLPILSPRPGLRVQVHGFVVSNAFSRLP